MISLCPSCWRPLSHGAATCPSCGADVPSLDRQSYTDKLIRALGHPDAQTVARVATILATTAPGDAYVPLESSLWHYWREPYLAAAIVEALGLLDSSAARTVINEALGHESVIVRAAAAKALQRPRPEAPKD